MRNTYGQTWWGQQFLKALQQIDFSNRLPRGRTYANKGAVLDITLDGAEVKARVQGSRLSPYKQQLRLIPFTAAEQQQVVTALTRDPFLLSQLLNRELPPGVEAALQDEGVAIFPRRWKDVEAKCSCPDWAVPCKHLAAVIYTLANEVDKNPFLVFRLRGLDLIDALEAAGFMQVDAVTAQIPAVAGILRPEPDMSPPQPLAEALARLDFSRLPDCREKLLRLLPPQPAFYPRGDFHRELDRWYKAAARHARGLSLPDALEPLPYDLSGLLFEWDDHLDLRQLILRRPGETLSWRDHDALDQLLTRLQATEGPHRPALLTYLETLWQFARHLVQQHALIPQLLSLPGGAYRLRWIPATLDPVVASQFEALTSCLPPGLLLYLRGRGITGYLDRAEQVRSLVAALVAHMLGDLDFSRSDDDPVAELFFGEGTFTPGGQFGEADTPYAIQQWLERFYLGRRDRVPVLKIDLDEPDFLLTFWIEDKTDALAPLVALPDFLTDGRYQAERLGLLRDLASLETFLPQVQQALAGQGRQAVRLDGEAFVPVLTDALPVLELMGIRVLLPKALQRIARPQAALAADGAFEAPDAGASYLNLADMLSFRWQVAVGDQWIDPQQFLAQVQHLRGLVKVQDTYVLIDDKEMKALLKKLADPPEPGAATLQAALSETYDGQPVRLSTAARRRIQALLAEEPVTPPATVQATLRPYQARGYAWLYKNDRVGFGSILADDMGLGKTLQVITFLAQLAADGQLRKQKALAVVPTTLLSNWEREVAKFAPSLRTTIFHGPNRHLDLDACDLVLTSYGVARSDQAIIGKPTWRVLIIDEAQAIKNPSTGQAKAIKKLKARTRIAMSGTPVENRLSEYWSIFDFVQKGYLASLKRFKDTYILPIEQDRDQEKLREFLAITQPFILRRVKTDKTIISDLPDKIEQDQLCVLSPEQAALYENVIGHNLEQIEANEGIVRAGLVFKLMTALKQVCNHPAHFLKKTQADPIDSGKATRLLQLLTEIRDRGEKVLIFTQYREMGDLLVQMLAEAFPEPALFLHGGLSRPQRDQLVDAFQTQPYAWAFVLSLKAAGTGLNLTAANHVIHYDLWWNPAVEAQATDRAFRIGQQKNVLVHRFITQGTFEERINDMIQQKRELADLTVQTGETWIGDLSNAELRKLFVRQ